MSIVSPLVNSESQETSGINSNSRISFFILKYNNTNLRFGSSRTKRRRYAYGLTFKRYSSGDWYFSFRPVNITARMFINEQGKVDYFIQVPEVGSSDNEYIESERQIIIFEEEDIEGLVKILKNEAIDGFINKPSAADLFN